ncbi:hypothetical protein [Pseudomonas sp. GZD-222]|uniref:hypothetical protein n=1 Tax=Pseudomonas sp. GZD-222 TaxID=3404805 RepID=UPI003BB658F5
MEDQVFQDFQELVVLAGRPILVDPASSTSDLVAAGQQAGLSTRTVIEGLGKAGALGSQSPSHLELNRLIVYKNVSERASKYRADPTDASWMPLSQAKTPETRESLKASMSRFAPVIDGMYQEQHRLIEAEYPGYLATLGDPMIHPDVQFQLQVSLNQLVSRFRDAVEHVMATAWVPGHIRGFPEGCCGTISELLGEHLNSLDIGEFNYVCGEKRGGATHAWLEVYGLVVDITADQFSGRPAVYVAPQDAWYRAWKVRSNRFAVHEPSSHYYGDESRFLDQVLEHMQVLSSSTG